MYKPIKLSEVPAKRRKTNPQVMSDLKDFLETSTVAGEVRIPEGQLVKHTYAAYHNAVVRYGYPIEVTVRGGRLFLLKKKTAPGAATPKGGK